MPLVTEFNKDGFFDIATGFSKRRTFMQNFLYNKKGYLNAGVRDMLRAHSNSKVWTTYQEVHKAVSQAAVAMLEVSDMCR